MWQADHTPLDVWLLDEEGKPAKPYLTAIEDDYSRMIVGYRLSFQTATALTTALTLEQFVLFESSRDPCQKDLTEIFLWRHAFLSHRRWELPMMIR